MKILTQWLRQYVPVPVGDHELASDLTLRGIAVDGVFDLGSGNKSIFEMDITTNRVDAMNHYGIAREAAAIYPSQPGQLPLKPLDITLPAARTGADFPVTIEAPELCGRFTARVLRDVSIGPSTGIVAEYFGLLEQKLILNAVDASNFVWMAMGQPTHAFDLDKLEGGIIVRRARDGEKLRLLDGTERTLGSEDLVVADERKALGLAGVMGGWDSMITPQTKNILIEAAWFDPAAIRGSSRRHGIHTDASHRFERGADFNAATVASALVSKIILENGGYIEGELIDVIIPAAAARTARRQPVAVSVSEVRRILGTAIEPDGIDASTVETVLSSLGCQLLPSGNSSYQVTLPSWRLDLEREIDLIEEVARVYGYNKFANTLPDFAGAVVELPFAQKEEAVRWTLLASGWNEAISSTFVSVTDAVTFSPYPQTAVPIENPLSEEAGMLRPSLVPGMLTMLATNLNRDVEGVRLFEAGTIFSGITDRDNTREANRDAAGQATVSRATISRVDERPALAIGAAGNAPLTGPHHPAQPIGFHDIKGLVEQVLHHFSWRSCYFDAFPADSGLLPAWLHPGRAARAVIDGLTVGFFGQLHPAEAQRRKLRQHVFVGELYLDRLYTHTLRSPAARELSRFQPVRRDFSLNFPGTVRWAEIEQSLRSVAIAEMTHFAPKEIFRSEDEKQSGAQGDYSLLLSTVFQSDDHTLRDEEILAFSDRIAKAMTDLGAVLRGRLN